MPFVSSCRHANVRKRTRSNNMHLLCRGTGTPILFIHGMPTSSRLWTGVIERLCGQFTCYAVDLPGFGDTPPEAYAPNYLPNLAARIDELRIKNGIERWHVVGHDAGSAVAVQYAHQYQSRVQRLVLLAPALFPELRPYYLLELLRKPWLGEVLAPLIAPIFWSVAMRRAARDEEGSGLCFARDLQRPFRGIDGCWNFMRVMRWGHPADVLSDIPRCLPNLQMPTLIFYGSRDPAIPKQFAERASTLIPNCRLVPVDSGHFIPLNRPTFLATNLTTFLNAQ